MSIPVYVTDTHPLVWYLGDSPRLSPAARTAFEQIERGFEIHDRAIVATAKSFQASLITKDEHVRQSVAVPCIW